MHDANVVILLQLLGSIFTPGKYFYLLVILLSMCQPKYCNFIQKKNYQNCEFLNAFQAIFHSIFIYFSLKNSYYTRSKEN